MSSEVETSLEVAGKCIIKNSWGFLDFARNDRKKQMGCSDLG